MAPIRNGVELLKLTGSIEPAVLETTKMMERQVIHLVRLVDDLLDVSRIVTGKIHLDQQPIDISDVIDRAIEEVQPTLDVRGHELMLVRPARRTVVEGDMVRLAEVVSNLLSNAARYTDKPSQIWLTIEPREEDVLIRVRDQGVGMAADDLTKIFNLFEQGDSTISRTRGGLGIGLTLVKRIVEMHGGDVTAHSAGLEQGSEFIVRLPTSGAVPSSPRSSGRFGEAKEQGRRILVVDDNVDAALSIERLLKSWGHEVQTVFNGFDAVAKRTFQAANHLAGYWHAGDERIRRREAVAGRGNVGRCNYHGAHGIRADRRPAALAGGGFQSSFDQAAEPEGACRAA